MYVYIQFWLDKRIRNLPLILHTSGVTTTQVAKRACKTLDSWFQAFGPHTCHIHVHVYIHNSEWGKFHVSNSELLMGTEL